MNFMSGHCIAALYPHEFWPYLNFLLEQQIKLVLILSNLGLNFLKRRSIVELSASCFLTNLLLTVLDPMKVHNLFQELNFFFFNILYRLPKRDLTVFEGYVFTRLVRLGSIWIRFRHSESVCLNCVGFAQSQYQTGFISQVNPFSTGLKNRSSRSRLKAKLKTTFHFLRFGTSDT